MISPIGDTGISAPKVERLDQSLQNQASTSLHADAPMTHKSSNDLVKQMQGQITCGELPQITIDDGKLHS